MTKFIKLTSADRREIGYEKKTENIPNDVPQMVIIVGAVVQLVEYRTRNQEVAGSTHTRSTASNLEHLDNLLCAQANSASYPQRDGKSVVATATGEDLV